MSDDLALVRAAVKRHGSSKVARQVGVSEGTVRHWMQGSSEPRPKAREAIRAAFGVTSAQSPPETAPNGHRSSVSPSGIVPKPAQKSESGPIAPTAAVEKGEAIDVDAANPIETAVHVLEKLLAALQKARGARLASIANSITRATKLLAELTGHIEVTESQILRSAAWARLRTAVWGALEDFPEAMRAVNDALERLNAA